MQTVTDNLIYTMYALAKISVDLSFSNEKSVSLRYITDILTHSEKEYYKKLYCFDCSLDKNVCIIYLTHN